MGDYNPMFSKHLELYRQNANIVSTDVYAVHAVLRLDIIKYHF